MNNQKKLAVAFVAFTMLSAAIILSPTANAENLVPSWIKNNAGWWAEGTVDDTTFLNGIKFLVENQIIKISDSKPLGTDKIRIGLIPVEKAEELSSKATDLEKFLESELNTDVEIVIPTDYETLVEAMRFGHIDAAFMDTGPAWVTHQRTGAEAIMAELVDGKVNYSGTVWIRANDNSMKSIDDVIGKRVAFTSITGSSGFVRPMGTLVDKGLITIEGDDIVALYSALDKNFESYTFAGGYKAALELLIDNKVDVAFGSDIAPKKYLSPADQLKVKAIDSVGKIPSHVFLVQKDMPESTRQALVNALIKLNYDEHNSILRNLYGAEALVPTSTALHIGDFGKLIDKLSGLDQVMLQKPD